MPAHKFTIFVHDLPTRLADMINSLSRHGCNDACVTQGKNLISLDFTRHCQNKNNEINRVIKNIRQAGFRELTIMD